ncbi:hypothetical protein LTR70_003928 [Exophiala xenobiotica]|uniref:Uncharacterized protein n=1 Tax=Lithohypha guttulata TaxID=1690604 RepID=A0ABR0K9G5_9EURO|nr:hypothetical protein LTR24_005308 [Lithohypha guttulata]KAK5322081.1 hypothetical protein LTR70_003928 [Exophiala xenobiotica]
MRITVLAYLDATAAGCTYQETHERREALRTRNELGRPKQEPEVETPVVSPHQIFRSTAPAPNSSIETIQDSQPPPRQTKKVVIREKPKSASPKKVDKTKWPKNEDHGDEDNRPTESTALS